MMNRRAMLIGVPSMMLAGAARAQGLPTWPTRPIRLVTVGPPGGSADFICRLLAQHLQPRLGQPVVVENRTGGNFIPGTEAMIRAAPDGYTIGQISSYLAASVSLSAKLPYDPLHDISPIIEVGSIPSVLVVNAAVPAKTYGELAALAKAKPGTLNCATSGKGTATHFALELFKLQSGLDVSTVHYRGGGPAMNDLLGGQVQMAFAQTTAVAAQLPGGRIRALAVTGAKRSTAFPDLPALNELGFVDFDVSEWFGIIGPAGLPAPLVSRLHAEIKEVLAQPDVDERLRKVGLEMSALSPVDMKAKFESEVRRLKDIVAKANITVE